MYAKEEPEFVIENIGGGADGAVVEIEWNEVDETNGGGDQWEIINKEA